MNAGKKLRTLLKGDGYVFGAGVYTPLQAKLAEMTGLKVAFVSGYSSSLGYLGRSDLGWLTMSEMTTISRYIVNAVSIPIVADADDAYGNPIIAIRTVNEFARTGVAGIHVEDQAAPKRCGHLAGKVLLPFEESVAKIKAIVRERENPDLVIIARTDARGAAGGSLDEAIKRSIAFASAGADMLFCEFTSPDAIGEFKSFSRAVHKEYPETPLLFNYSSSFKWSKSRHKLTFGEIAEMGYKVIFVSMGAIHAEMYAVWNFMKDLSQNQQGAQFHLEKMKEGHPTENHHLVGNFEEFKEWEERYLPIATKEKYADSAGYHGEKRPRSKIPPSSAE